uniref:Zinc finger SWIM-type containing 9 n=1 Tax=Monodelphis domestica TaxID=13616 RepID=F7GAF6_MONDO
MLAEHYGKKGEHCPDGGEARHFGKRGGPGDGPREALWEGPSRQEPLVLALSGREGYPRMEEELEAEPEPGRELEGEPELGREQELKADSEPEPEPELELEPEPGEERGLQPGAELGPELDLELGPGLDLELGPQSEAEPKLRQARPEPWGQEERELQDREFFSWAEFSRFFDEWCQQRRALFFVKSSMHLAKCRWALDAPLHSRIDVLKYSYVQLACKDVRAPVPRRPGMAGSPQPGCPAFIILKLSPLRDRLVVTECHLAHSHPPCPLEFAYYFRPGHLLANACLPIRTTNKISKQFVAPEDIHRLLSYCKSRDHGVLDALRVLEGLFQADPEAKVKLVFVEDQAIVETVFFLTSSMMALLRRYPLMLFFDRLPGLQGTFDLSTVLCVDDFGQGREVACCLTRQTSPNLLRFTLASLVQSVPEIKGRVGCVTVGPEVGTQLEAVRELLPGARVQICRVQVLETLFSKAQELGGAGEDPGLWPLLCRLAGAASAAAYMEALAELRATCPAAFVDYFERSWAPRRAMWVRLWAFETARNVDACALVRGHRQRLLRGLSPSPTVAQCIRDLVALQRRASDDEDEVGGEGPSKAPVSGPGAGLENGGRRGVQWGDRGDRRTQVREGSIQLGDPGDRGSQLGSTGEWGRHFGEPDVQFVARGDKEMQPGNSAMELRDRGVYLWERSVQLGDREERARQLGDRGERGLPLWERGVQLGSRGERRIQLGERGAHLGDSGERGFHLWERGIQLEDREDSRGPLGEREAQPRDRGAELGQGGVHLEDRGERGQHLWDGGQMMQLGDREETGGMLGELQGRGRPAGATEDRAGARKRPRSSSEEEDWELLSRFRAVCGPELAGLVAEELTFARQHGVRGFRWTGTGYTLQDGTSDFLLDAALTRCSCSIHAARHLPCRHLFAARLVVGAALFHMDLLRDSWGGAPEP